MQKGRVRNAQYPFCSICLQLRSHSLHLPSGQQLGNLSPSIALAHVIPQYCPVLITAPRLLAYVRIEVIVPPLPTLLPDPPRQVGGNDAPLLGALLLHELLHGGILLGGSGSFDEGPLLPSSMAFLAARSATLSFLELGLVGAFMREG